MIRFLFRLLAMVALSVAVIMAVLDATRSIAASGMVITPLGASWSAVAPDSLALLQASAQRYLAVLWDPLMLWVLSLPGFVVFAVLALLFYAIGRKPERNLGRFAAES